MAEASESPMMRQYRELKARAAEVGIELRVTKQATGQGAVAKPQANYDHAGALELLK